MTLEEVKEHVLAQMGFENKELTDEEEEYIKKIYNSMNYLLKKYNKEFCYSSYYSIKSSEDDTIIYFYAKEADSYRDEFQVYSSMVDGKPIVKDDYMNVALRSTYNQYIKQALKRFNKDANIVVLSTIPGFLDQDMTEVPDDYSELNGLFEGFNDIYISDKNMSEEQYYTVIEEFKKWAMKNKMSTDNHFYYVEESVMNSTDFDSFNEHDVVDQYIKKDHIIISDSDWE